MTLLTEQQMEELVKAGAAAIAAYHGGEDNEDDEAHVRLALTAALPAIERAVLERAAKVCEDLAEHVFHPTQVITGRCAIAIRALAGEEPKSIVDENGNTGWVIP